MNPHEDSYTEVKARHEMICAELIFYRWYAVWQDEQRVEILSRTGLCARFKAMTYVEPAVGNKPFKRKRFITQWIHDHEKKLCHTVDSDGTLHSSHDFFNIFTGFKAAKLPAVSDVDVVSLVQPIIGYIYNVVARENKERAEWFENWLASIVQRPQNRHLIAVVVNGEGHGTGVLADFFRCEVLGMHCSLQSNNIKQDLFSRFAKGAIGTIFLQTDQEMQELEDVCGQFRGLITVSTITYKRQRMDPCQMENMVNVFMSTENTTGETLNWRFELFQARRVNDRAYIGELQQHLTRPDVARAFFQYLMGRDLSQFCCHTHPLPLEKLLHPLM